MKTKKNFSLKDLTSKARAYGILGTDFTNSINEGLINNRNFVIVDPAGSAFKGSSGKLSGDAASGAIYKVQGARNKTIAQSRPTSLSEIEGIKKDGNNKIIEIQNGYAVFNNVWEPDEKPETPAGVIHAVGPEGGSGNERQDILTQTLKNTFIEYHNCKATDSSGRKAGLRIPAISGNLYGGTDEQGPAGKELYHKRLYTAINEGYEQACQELGEEIDFGSHGLEICFYFEEEHKAFIAANPIGTKAPAVAAAPAKPAAAAPAAAPSLAPIPPITSALETSDPKEAFQRAWRYVFGEAGEAGENGGTSTAATSEERAFLRDELSKMVLSQGGTDEKQLLQDILQGSKQNDATELLGYFLNELAEPNIKEVSTLNGERGVETPQRETKVEIAAGKNTFSDLLGKRAEEEDLEDGNKKKLTLESVNETSELVFSLNRFKFKSGSAEKISTDITLNEIELDVSAEDGKAESAKKQKYEPTAFIVHDGNLNGGHYRAFIKEVDEQGNAAWFEYDDSRREKVAELDQEGLPEAAKQAYCVKYSPLADNAETNNTQGAARYKSGLPKSQSHGTSNQCGGNQCFANAAFAFLLSMTSLGRVVDKSQELPDLQSLIDKEASGTRQKATKATKKKPAAAASPVPKGETPKDEISTLDSLINTLLDFQDYRGKTEDKKPTLKNILEAIKGATKEDLKTADDFLLESRCSTSQALLRNATNEFLASLSADSDDEQASRILETYAFFADKNNPKFSLEVLSAIEESGDKKNEFCQDPSAFIIKNTKWKCVDESKDFQATPPSTAIKVTYCKPFAPSVLKIGTKSITQYWKTSSSADQVIAQRANNFRAASIYGLKKGDENNKKKEEIIKTHLDVILLAANEAKKNDKSLSHDDVLEVIKFAKENGGVLNTKKLGAPQAQDWMVDFSRIYQEKMQASGIFTGRQGEYKAVGSRLTFLPAEVLAKIQEEDFKGKFAASANEEAVREATTRITELGKAVGVGGAGR